MARTSARHICPASSTTSTSTELDISSRAQSQAVPASHLRGSARQERPERRHCHPLGLSSDHHNHRPRLPSGSLPTERPSRRATLQISCNRLLMTLWLTAVIPTLLPLLTNSTTIRAPVKVLPEPGGPCTGSTETCERRASTTCRAALVSWCSTHGQIDIGKRHSRRLPKQEVSRSLERTRSR